MCVCVYVCMFLRSKVVRVSADLNVTTSYFYGCFSFSSFGYLNKVSNNFVYWSDIFERLLNLVCFLIFLHQKRNTKQLLCTLGRSRVQVFSICLLLCLIYISFTIRSNMWSSIENVRSKSKRAKLIICFIVNWCYDYTISSLPCVQVSRSSRFDAADSRNVR